MKFLFIIYISVISVFNFSIDNDININLINALKKGDTKTMGRFFSSSVKVSIDREELIATKAQAEIIVSEFLNDNRLDEIKQSHFSKDNSPSIKYLKQKQTRKI